MRTIVGYKTGSGNIMPLTLYIETVERNSIALAPQEEVGKLCGDCKGWNGGCPGCAPYFQYIKPKMQFMTVLLIEFDMAWAAKYSRGGRNLISSNYFRMGYADRITDKYAWSILKKSYQKGQNFILGCGHCPTCSKKHCGPINNLPCRKPLNRFYSMEATGVDCNQIALRITGQELQWWYKDSILPVNMTRVVGIINNDPQATEALLLDKVISHRSFVKDYNPSDPEGLDLMVEEVCHINSRRCYNAYVNLRQEYINE